MGAFNVRPETPEEHLIHGAIVGTWIMWLVGGLYLVGPAVGYLLLLMAAVRFVGLSGPMSGPEPRPADAMAPGVVLWVLGMFAMLVALVIAHFDFELGLPQTVKSAMGWVKGWSLLAVFVLAGAVLRIRPAVVFRAMGLLAGQTLLLVPLFVLAGVGGLPERLYVSPLQIIGGPGPEFFDVSLYTIDDTTGYLRWRFYSPWSTAAAFLAAIGLVFALCEKQVWWKAVGIAAALVVCFMSGSRLAVVALPVIVVAVMVAANIRRPEIVLVAAACAGIAVLFTDDMVMAYEDLHEAFSSARVASSRVREALASIAFHRWLTEAPVFGHGIVERGPHLVQYMPIGSHHTWLGLLFVKGAVGFLGLALPLAWTIGELTLKAQADRVARAALGVAITVLLFSFGDNLEIVAYLIWPGMLVIGIALRRRLCSPYRGYLGASV